MPLRAHYARAGRLPPAPPFPEPLRYLWGWFHAVHRGRSRNGMALTAASHLDLLAWQWNSGIRCKPWEADLLMTLGMIWVDAMTGEAAPRFPADGASLPPPPKIGDRDG